MWLFLQMWNVVGNFFEILYKLDFKSGSISRITFLTKMKYIGSIQISIYHLGMYLDFKRCTYDNKYVAEHKIKTTHCYWADSGTGFMFSIVRKWKM